ncbi:hypothetical protein PIB30_061487 [Stylosanthes scabra]|uniref:NTF2-like domain-containing protein n=1 Tax=Stylosanthes scabra TaxID=79078 RepID=A0ABU6QLB8_9FABA|nr:hypothetical protein [Stylosanthes scabra]
MALLMHSPEMSIAPQIVKNPNPNLSSKLYSFRPYHKKCTNRAIGSNREVKISCKVKELGVLNVGLDPNVKRSSRQSKAEEEKQNYYVNLGYAIRTLREEFPDLFYKELSFDIYRDDIVFKDPLNTFMGIENYKSIFWALRFHGRIFFKALWIDISTVWQPVEDIIMVRWTVHGIPRVPWESRGRFDGTSVYKLDKQGKIYEHRVDNIILNSPPRFKVLGVEELIRSVGGPSTPKPTYFEVSSTTERT